jgi:glycine hydroxymethyltransferase
MDELAALIAGGLALEDDPAGVAAEVTQWRSRFSGVHFTAGPDAL